MNPIRKELVWFVAITLPLTYAVGSLAWYASSFQLPISVATMYIPALIVMLLYWVKFKKPVFRGGDLGFRFTGWKYWLIAPLALTGICLVSYFLSYFLNPDMFQHAEVVKTSLSAKGLYFGNVLLSMVLVFLINNVVGGIINIPMFLGEEVGWRAFMTPRLIKLLNPKLAFMIGGIIWAFWHLVMISQGLNYPNHPIAGVGMMVLLCIPVGVIIQYFYFRSRSIFVAALAHAGMNKSAMSMSFMIDDKHYNTFFYGPTGVIGIVLFWILALYLFRKIDWKNENLLRIAQD